MKCLIIIASATAAQLVSTPNAAAQECNGKAVRVRDISRRDVYYPLFIVDQRGQTFGVDGYCAKLYAPNFFGVITFFVRNKFQNFEDVPIGILRIQSLRTFSVPTGAPIKVSRKAGWYADGAGKIERLAQLKDRPVRLGPKEWTQAHSSDGQPAVVNERLGLKWHGFADEDKELPSTDSYKFWSFPSENADKQSLTNYLIRFSSAAEGEDINFHAEVPQNLEKLDLRIDSNFDILRGNYTFVFER